MKYALPLLSSFEHPDDRLRQVSVSSPDRGSESCLCRLSLEDGSSERTKYLMRTVLADAVQCFQMNFGDQDGLRAKDFADVRWWLFENEADEPFSFEQVCSVLELDPASLRQALRDFGRRRIAGRVQPRAGRSAVTRRQSRELTEAARTAARERAE
jgi:hypothetical protein